MDSTQHTAVIIGAGVSGICLGIFLKNAGIDEFIILEKAYELGGVWHENTYPGAECDLPSGLYSFSFESFTDWPAKWSSQQEILTYLKYCAKKNDLYQHIRFGQTLKSAQWDEAASLWNMNTDKDGFQCQHLITAVGQLHHPFIPSIKGIDDFRGTCFHSARWDHGISLEGKNIAVVGNAASAVQFIPHVAKSAANLTVFQRSAGWVLPKNNHSFSAWKRALYRRFPFLFNLTQRIIPRLFTPLVYFLMKSEDSLIRRLTQNENQKYIRQHIKDEEVVQKLTPTFPLGAKRLLMSDHYYQALAQPNVQLETSSIAEITPTGIITKDNRKEYDFDLIIFGTGFISDPFLLGLNIIGRSGVRIHETWKESPSNYLGITISGFPNMYMMYGPNTNLGHDTLIPMIEAQAKYIVQCISEVRKQKWNSIDTKHSAMQTYYDSIQKRLRSMAWALVKSRRYQSENGNIVTNWPGRTSEYERITKRVNWSDFLVNGNQTN